MTAINPEEREAVACEVYDAMVWAANLPKARRPPEWVLGGNSHAQAEARRAADAILSTLSSRSEVEEEAEEWKSRAHAYELRLGSLGKDLVTAEASISRLTTEALTWRDCIGLAETALAQSTAHVQRLQGALEELIEAVGYEPDISASHARRLARARAALSGEGGEMNGSANASPSGALHGANLEAAPSASIRANTELLPHLEPSIQRHAQFIDAALSYYHGTGAARDVRDAWKRITDRLTELRMELDAGHAARHGSDETPAPSGRDTP